MLVEVVFLEDNHMKLFDWKVTGKDFRVWCGMQERFTEKVNGVASKKCFTGTIAWGVHAISITNDMNSQLIVQMRD